MKLNIFLSALLVVSGRHCSGASIADELTVEELERAEVSPSEEQAEAFEVARPESVAVPGELIELEPEEPRIVEEFPSESMSLSLQQAPMKVIPVEEEFPSGRVSLSVQQAPIKVIPVDGEENCESPLDIIDEVSADRAERQANVDLLKALDTVLAHKETLDDVMRSEDAIF